MTQKNISVLLLKDVEKLGNTGSINSVKLGAKKQAIEAENIQKSKELANVIEDIKTFTIKKKVGKDGLIFGSVTNQDIANCVELTTQQTIDKKAITIPTIKKVGVYDINIKFNSSVNANINLQVLGDENE